MIRDQLLTVAIAVCCISAIAGSASTLESTVKTDPGDVVDVPVDWLPFGAGTVADLKWVVVEHEPGGSESARSPETAEQARPPDAASAPPADPTSESRSTGASDQQRDGGGSGADAPKTQSLLDQLLELLRWLVAAVFSLGLLAAAVRYRDRLMGLLSAVLERLGLRPEVCERERIDPVEPAALPDGVTRAWYLMIQRLELERGPAKTPGEYAEDAIAAGGDPDSVRLLTRLFQDRQYGGEPATADRERLAASALDRIRPPVRRRTA